VEHFFVFLGDLADKKQSIVSASKKTPKKKEEQKFSKTFTLCHTKQLI